MAEEAASREPTIVPPEGGRHYPMGRMRAVFKADGDEAAGRYSISEWWLEPRTRGPGTHRHDEDHVFYVIAGTLGLRLGEDGDWLSLAQGGYALIPGGTPHDFRNEGKAPAGFISFNVPGGFERRVGGPDGIAAALSSMDLSLG